MFRASHKQWEVAILILINICASIKFRIVEMDNWLNLNKRPAGTRSVTLSRPRQTHEPLDYATSSLKMFMVTCHYKLQWYAFLLRGCVLDKGMIWFYQLILYTYSLKQISEDFEQNGFENHICALTWYTFFVCLGLNYFFV